MRDTVSIKKVCQWSLVYASSHTSGHNSTRVFIENICGVIIKLNMNNTSPSISYQNITMLSIHFHKISDDAHTPDEKRLPGLRGLISVISRAGTILGCPTLNK